MHDARTPVRPTLVYELADPRAAFTTDEHVVVAAAFLASYRNPNTRANYGQALKQWFAWCRRHDLDPLHDVKRPHIEMWLRTLEEVEHNQPSTVCGKLNALVGYYRTAVIDEHLVEDLDRQRGRHVCTVQGQITHPHLAARTLTSRSPAGP